MLSESKARAVARSAQPQPPDDDRREARARYDEVLGQHQRRQRAVQVRPNDPGRGVENQEENRPAGERAQNPVVQRPGHLAKGQGYDADPDVFHGKVSARVAAELVSAGVFVRANLSKITLPTLILHGSADPLAKPEFSEAIYAGLGSMDKTIKRYDGFLHEILNETQKDRVLADIGAWLAAHR